jgi:hypothetical protein
MMWTHILEWLRTDTKMALCVTYSSNIIGETYNDFLMRMRLFTLIMKKIQMSSKNYEKVNTTLMWICRTSSTNRVFHILVRRSVGRRKSKIYVPCLGA